MDRRSMLPFMLGLLLAMPAWTTANADELEWKLLPAQIELSGSSAEHRVLVQTVVGGQLQGPPGEPFQLKSLQPEIAQVEGNLVRPVADGVAEIVAELRDSKKVMATARVRVSNATAPPVWSFRNHVQPVLAKAGCNSGACHGALAGKGGFKLSLRGYDTSRDHFTMTRQARGRRVELREPARSLLLIKPTGAVPHKGGVRFEVDSLEYRIISEWIASGAESPRSNDPVVESLEVFPSLAVLGKGDSQPLLVRANYSDGTARDVTRWCKFNSTNESVAQVDANGRIDVIGYGEGAVTAWFDSRIVTARVTSPYAYEVDPQIYANLPSRGFIDEAINKQLERLNLEPSSRAEDHEFLRRVFLDAIGTLPTAEEAEAFLADASEDKRDQLIDALLERPEFVDYWTYKWSDVLMLNGNLLRPEAIKSYYQWIHEHVEKNTPWDQFVTEILTAQGGTLENGATNFYSIHQDPEGMTENACQAFLGLSIGCAKCHNHPLEKWTNDQYYAMANLFSRVRAKGWGGDSRSGNGVRTIYAATRGELIQPLTGKPQPPTPLDGQPIEFSDPSDRRAHLAKWMTSPENPYFARSITNRIWHNFFGVGLVESVDDMRVSNPASNEQLLTSAADFLIQNKFNLKALMREIMRSHAYQRTSRPSPNNMDESRFYSRYYPKRLMAEVLLDAISQVTAAPSEFNEIAFPGGDKKKTDFYPKGTRAIQLYDSAVDSYFLKTFGRNQRRITCECERSDEPTIVQVLHLSNGVTLNEKLRAEGNRLSSQIADATPDEQILGKLFLSALARRPTERERERLLTVLKETPEEEKRAALEDLYWGVLSSREFIFNH